VGCGHCRKRQARRKACWRRAVAYEAQEQNLPSTCKCNGMCYERAYSVRDARANGGTLTASDVVNEGQRQWTSVQVATPSASTNDQSDVRHTAERGSAPQTPERGVSLSPCDKTQHGRSVGSWRVDMCCKHHRVPASKQSTRWVCKAVQRRCECLE
jgi:hypothetical protein